MTTRVMHLIASPRVDQRRRLAQLVAQLADPALEMQLVALGRAGDAAVSRNGAPSANGTPSASYATRSLALRRAADPCAVRRLKQCLDAFAPHVVHAADRRSARYAAAALAWGGGPALVVGPWSPSDDQPGARRWWNRLVERRANRVLVASPRQQAPTRKRDVVIPPGVAPFSPDPDFRRALLAELQLPQATKLVGVAGPLSPRRRIKDAIWAADLLKCVRDDTHLLILGEGPHRWRLQRYRRQVQITDRVHFLGQRADEREILASLDCYWDTAGDEPPAMPMLEALAAGVPVVAVDAPAAAELFAAADLGPLVAPGDRASRARRTNELLDDAELAQAQGEAGLRLVAEYFPFQAMLDAHRALYRELAGS